MKVYQVISHNEERQTIGVFYSIDLDKLAIRKQAIGALISIEELELDNPNYETSKVTYFDYGYDQGLIQRKMQNY